MGRMEAVAAQATLPCIPCWRTMHLLMQCYSYIQEIRFGQSRSSWDPIWDFCVAQVIQRRQSPPPLPSLCPWPALAATIVQPDNRAQATYFHDSFPTLRSGDIKLVITKTIQCTHLSLHVHFLCKDRHDTAY